MPADLHLARYGRDALARLRAATDAYLESLRGGDNPTAEQVAFGQVYDSVLAYEQSIEFSWEAPEFPGDCPGF